MARRQHDAEREGRIRKAMQHQDKPGAGARARDRYLEAPSEHAEAIMREFHRGTLRSGGSGMHVTNPAQARAIARSVKRQRAHGK